MAKHKPEVVPQRRYRSNQWTDCEPHQAQAWCARIGARVIGRYGNKPLALEALGTALLRKAGPTRRYQLGGVLEPKPSGVDTYATSLTRAEFERTR